MSKISYELYTNCYNTPLNQCQLELTKQSRSCSITKLSFDTIEYDLKELVNRERKYLSTRNNEQLIQFKDHIYEKNLFNTISTSSLINYEQVINLFFSFLFFFYISDL